MTTSADTAILEREPPPRSDGRPDARSEHDAVSAWTRARSGSDMPRLSAEWRSLDALGSLVEPWRALAARALEPNVFYDPTFALAAAPVFGRGVGAVLVWSDEATPRLTGLFPARIANWRSGFPLPVLLGWTHPYAPLGAPLVDRDNPEATIAAWLDFVARDAKLPKRVLLPLAPTANAFAHALQSVLARSGGRCAAFGQHGRALLCPGEDRGSYLDLALSAKKRKELARQRRRLAEHGDVATDIATSPTDVAVALDQFMALEQGGWKGRGGTAVAQHAPERAFMRQAVTELAAHGQAQVVRLSVGGRAVAAGILLRSGDAAWFWKIAYDEDAARASPGVQLTLDLTQAALADATLARVDSCATAHHPMIDHLWRQRLDLADHLIAVGPSAGARFAIARAAETLRRNAFDAARRLRNRLR